MEKNTLETAEVLMPSLSLEREPFEGPKSQEAPEVGLEVILFLYRRSRVTKRTSIDSVYGDDSMRTVPSYYMKERLEICIE